MNRLAHSSTSRANEKKNKDKHYLSKPSTDRDNSLRERRGSTAHTHNIDC